MMDKISIENPFIGFLKQPTAYKVKAFHETAQEISCDVSMVERDFWTAFVLDTLLNRVGFEKENFTLKGSSSLINSAQGVVARSYTDLDIVLDKKVLGFDFTDEKLGSETKNKKKQIHRDMDEKSFAYLDEIVVPKMKEYCDKVCVAMSVEKIEIKRERGLIYVEYPSLTHSGNGKNSIVMDIGCRASIGERHAKEFRSLLSKEFNGGQFLEISGTHMMSAEWTFWEKAMAIHSINALYESKGELPEAGSRLSRHYLDLACMIRSQEGIKALFDYKRISYTANENMRAYFIRSNDYGMEQAVPGTMSLVPSEKVVESLKADYEILKKEMFGEKMEWKEVIESIKLCQDFLSAHTNSQRPQLLSEAQKNRMSLRP